MTKNNFPLSNRQRGRVGDCWEGGGGVERKGGEQTTGSGAAPATTRGGTLELGQIRDVGQPTGQAGDVDDECEHPSAVAIEEEREEHNNLPEAWSPRVSVSRWPQRRGVHAAGSKAWSGGRWCWT
jgi:hypothetical protein